MARFRGNNIEEKQLELAREQMDRAAVASGNVDENSALYRRAKLEGWDLGPQEPLHGKAGRKWLAGQNMAQEQAPGRSSVSGFGADMDTGRLTKYNQDGSQETYYQGTPAERMFTQMGELIEQGKTAREQKRNMDDAALASAMIYAKQNGGFVPPDMLQAMSAQLGKKITGGNYTRDGNFVLYGDGSKVDPRTGRVIQSGGMVPIAVASPEMQYGVLSRSGLGGNLTNELYDNIRKTTGLTDDQLADRGIVPYSGNAGKNGKRGYTLEEKLKIIEAETERQLKVAKAKKEGGEQMQAIKTYAQLLKDPALRTRLEKLGDEEANKFVKTLTAVMGLGENAGAQSQEGNSGAQRSAAEIRANPQDGDELPLKGGGKARYNGKTGKWEAAN